MLFHSLDYAIFLPTVIVLYWLLVKKNIKFQNLLIVIASYVFYGWWDWRFLSLIMLSTIVDYSIGIGLSRIQNISKRKTLLWLSVLVNLGLLGTFKYYNFFLENFIDAFSFFGAKINANTLNIILPVGISFYTFQTLSYTIDVYKKKLKPTNDLIAFSAFVCFFPQLVAGPIERASDLLPQFQNKRIFDYNKSIDGLRQILWGLFKKMVIADNCAKYVDLTFTNPEQYSGSTLFIGAFLFSIQIYCDFSAYSDIAIGTARQLGFNLTKNFNFPIFSRDIAEFWRNWHISLSSWFRDYLYFPLGGSRGNTWLKVKNLYIIFIVIGFWHGANWKYILYGAIHASYYLPLLLLNKNRINTGIVSQGKYFPSIRTIMNILMTFNFVLLARVFFRAESVKNGMYFLSKIFSKTFFQIPDFLNDRIFIKTFIFIGIFLIIEWFGRDGAYAISKIKFNRPIRWVFYYILIFSVFYFSAEEQQFIYFQF